MNYKKKENLSFLKMGIKNKKEKKLPWGYLTAAAK
jgi:hypothetical protein